MNRDPLIVAARALALHWYAAKHAGGYTAEAYKWAQDNFIGFLSDATEEMGKAFLGMELSPEEKARAAADLVRAKESYRKR